MTKIARQPSAMLFIILSICGWPIFGSLVGISGSDASQVPALAFRILVVAIGVIAFARHKTHDINAGILLVISLTFWVVYISKLIAEIYILEEPSPQTFETYIGYALTFSALPALCAFIDISDQTLNQVRKYITILSILGLSLSLLDIYAAFARGAPYFYAAMLRLGSEKMNPIALGHLCTTLVILLVCTIGASDRKLHAAAISVPIIAAAVISLFLTASKGPIVALAACLLVYLIRTIGFVRFGLGLLIFSALVGTALIAGSANLDASQSLLAPLFNRFSGLASGSDDQSTAGRLIAYTGALNQFFDHPVMGDVPFERATYNYPHNIFLEVLMSTGVIGFGLFAIQFVYGAKATLGCIRGTGTVWLGLLTLQYFIGALFSGAIYTNSLTWYLGALAIAVYSRPTHQR